jgi:hypothetical protein
MKSLACSVEPGAIFTAIANSPRRTGRCDSRRRRRRIVRAVDRLVVDFEQVVERDIEAGEIDCVETVLEVRDDVLRPAAGELARVGRREDEGVGVRAAGERSRRAAKDPVVAIAAADHVVAAEAAEPVVAVAAGNIVGRPRCRRSRR